jgi:hypothetical protein
MKGKKTLPVGLTRSEFFLTFVLKPKRSVYEKNTSFRVATGCLSNSST